MAAATAAARPRRRVAPAAAAALAAAAPRRGGAASGEAAEAAADGMSVCRSSSRSSAAELPASSSPHGGELRLLGRPVSRLTAAEPPSPAGAAFRSLHQVVERGGLLGRRVGLAGVGPPRLLARRFGFRVVEVPFDGHGEGEASRTVWAWFARSAGAWVARTNRERLFRPPLKLTNRSNPKPMFDPYTGQPLNPAAQPEATLAEKVGVLERELNLPAGAPLADKVEKA